MPHPVVFVRTPLILTWALVPGGGEFDGGPVVGKVPPDVATVLARWLQPDPNQPDSTEYLGWACLPAGDYYWVGCCRGAGGSPQKGVTVNAAGWPLDGCDETFDPGTYLGNLAAVTSGTPARVGWETPPVSADGPWRNLAVELLTHLVDGMVRGCPVLVATATELLPPGPNLDFLVTAAAFARAGLPARLRQRCRVRIPSQSPGRFLGAEGADLLVIPAAQTEPTLTACRDATILDRRGVRLAGSEPAPTVRMYALAVWDAATRFPHGLTAFGERFDRLWDGAWPLPQSLVDLISTVFKLGVALHGSPEQRANLFANHLIERARGSELPWRLLIRDDEWRTFPQDRLTAYFLREPGGLTAGELALQRAIEGAFCVGGVNIDAGVRSWWDREDAAKRTRLLTLARSTLTLVSPTLVANLFGGLSLATLLGDGPVTGLLAAELDAGTLGRRATEAATLAVLAADAAVTGILCRAVRRGLLDLSWVARVIEQGEPAAMGQVLLGLVAPPEQSASWDEAAAQLIAAVRNFPPVDRATVLTLARTAQGIDPAAQPGVYFGLLDLVCAAEPESGPGALSSPLLERLWPSLDVIRDPVARRRVAAELLGGRWTCVGPRLLIDTSGALRPAWLDTLPDLLLASPELVAAMRLKDLIRMQPDRGGDPAPWTAAVTKRWRGDPPTVTDALVAADAWFDWRRHADLGPGEGHRSALLWLCAPAWVHHRVEGPEGLPPHWHRGHGLAPDGRPPECTWEAWRQVMADLDTGLTAAHIRSITAPPTHWPWIYPWEQEQIADLEARCCDEGALALVVDAGGCQKAGASAYHTAGPRRFAPSTVAV